MVIYPKLACVALLVAVVPVLGCDFVEGAPTTSPVLFADAVGTNWQSKAYSWDCTADYEAQPAAEGEYAISATLAPYGGLAFGTLRPLDTKGSSALAFSVRGQTGGEMLRVAVYDSSRKELPEVGGLSLAPFLPNGITQQYQPVTIPLSQLGAIDQPLSKVAIMSSSESPMALMVDAIRFVKPQ